MRVVTIPVVFFVFTAATGCGAHRLTPDGSTVASSGVEAPSSPGGALTLHPERAADGARIEATYRPAEMLADEPKLHLRGPSSHCRG
jgi:hypothetical protein